MPIIEITLFPGRDIVTKDLMARQIADAVAENGGSSIKEIHVLFHEVEKDNWSRGLILAANRIEPKILAKLERCEYASVTRIPFEAKTEHEYLAFRLNVINPALARQPGFVSAQLLRIEDESEYILILKWLTKAHADAWRTHPEHDAIKQRSSEMLSGQRTSIATQVEHLDLYRA